MLGCYEPYGGVAMYQPKQIAKDMLIIQHFHYLHDLLEAPESIHCNMYICIFHILPPPTLFPPYIILR